MRPADPRLRLDTSAVRSFRDLRARRWSSHQLAISVRSSISAVTFWTLSAWDSREALDGFSRADPHNTDITIIRPHMHPTTFVFWTVRGSDVPVRWDEARRRLTAAMTG